MITVFRRILAHIAVEIVSFTYSAHAGQAEALFICGQVIIVHQQGDARLAVAPDICAVGYKVCFFNGVGAAGVIYSALYCVVVIERGNQAAHSQHTYGYGEQQYGSYQLQRLFYGRFQSYGRGTAGFQARKGQSKVFLILLTLKRSTVGHHFAVLKLYNPVAVALGKVPVVRNYNNQPVAGDVL